MTQFLQIALFVVALVGTFFGANGLASAVFHEHASDPDIRNISTGDLLAMTALSIGLLAVGVAGVVTLWP